MTSFMFSPRSISASSFTLLSSPKTEEGPSEGMGRETKKESVRVCNFAGSATLGEPDAIELEGWNDRVEVKRPEYGPSTLLLPSTSGDLESCPGVADASAAP